MFFGVGNRAIPRRHGEGMSHFPRRIPVRSVVPADSGEPLVIDCDTCVMHDTDACADCVVSFLLDNESDEETSENTAVVLDLNEIRALKALGDAGLVPTLRHRASG
ncbi:MAG: hypothetical protein RLZZ368_1552 [Actinomycetota bacterium]|jgi:hypothetical protein